MRSCIGQRTTGAIATLPLFWFFRRLADDPCGIFKERTDPSDKTPFHERNFDNAVSDEID